MAVLDLDYSKFVQQFIVLFSIIFHLMTNVAAANKFFLLGL
jgi:hypothetical protein